MLRINRDFSLDDLEDGLESLASGEKTLSLPHSIKSNAAGTGIALLQLIITWARMAGEQATLRLHSDVADQEGQRKLAQTIFGLTALNLAKSVQARSAQPLDRFSLLGFARDYVIAMAEKPIAVLRGYDKASLPFLCVDNARNYRRPARLYVPGTDRVRGRSDFESLVRSCASWLPGSRRLRDDDVLEAAASLLYEAFQNTHDHAQTDFRGELLRRSVRGFTIGFQYVHLDALADAGGSSTSLRAYYESWRPKLAREKHAQFLEFGIFDSGPGLARRWLSRDETLAEGLPDGNHLIAEYEAVAGCLGKGATTKTSLTSGNGLFRIMQGVKRAGGFILIRTGNLALIKAFDNSGSAITPDDLRLLDMQSGTQDVVRRPWSEGTTISVLLPTNRAMQQ